ncbi:MAG: DUF6516 family protein [Thermodesulfobacteriota bacterium]|nr:DUF6516 family protein [Thermodesulfobacteriota bacterium]
MIKRCVENIEKTIASSSIVLSSDLQKHFGPALNTVYIRGQLFIIDASILEMAIFATEALDSLYVDKYRFHYRDGTGKMLFRYDNAPHHSEVDSHPHHKHTPGKIVPSKMPSLEDLLNEISAIIVAKGV